MESYWCIWGVLRSNLLRALLQVKTNPYIYHQYYHYSHTHTIIVSTSTIITSYIYPWEKQLRSVQNSIVTYNWNNRPIITMYIYLSSSSVISVIIIMTNNNNIVIIIITIPIIILYCRYISTYYVRRGIDFGSFKRDVLLFKTLALAQLFYHYLFPSVEVFVFDPISILMIITGYTVSLMATNAIGIDRTYFGAELG